ncbi:carboxypeptidase-like regulatory domain-containing protein [Polaribacter batillariae]|uniref:Carboxypeptidase-like regulatory domain-containing protein n=1 Tax=Polaribacter batillariae TaxID=2808900 RepID=A0ABX7SUQ2_9FLAO|nr:MG2 domain-containing protein [Polaribacter batillariae]QTD37065.1 carboxypeptidase-like regulatory domain-containing protein [Polaribacter batillariae]
MKNTTIPFLLMILFSLTTYSQNNYDKLWTEVEKLEVDGLPKSALKMVDKIYDAATKENSAPQIIKSLFYKSKFALTLEEDAQLKVINNFKEHISKSNFPTKNVLQNVLANLYWQYYTQNRYKFYNRTNVSSKSQLDQKDFRTWDLNTLFKEIHTYYKASLLNEKELQNIKITEFADILQIEKDAKTVRPTLFDFLANNALTFYKTSENSINKPAYQFKIDAPSYLGDAYRFSNIKITSKDSLSLQMNALKVYQKLICFHLSESNTNALADIDIQRLHFVNNNATFSHKETILISTLKNSKEKYKNVEASGLYGYEIANIYKNQANRFKSAKENRFKNKDAIAICNEVINQFPESLGAKKCKVLKAQIEEKTIRIRAEKYIPIDKNSRLEIDYKNIDTLYFSIYKISKNDILKLNKTYKSEDKIAFINKLKSSENWNNSLRNENDYLQHTTEVIVPKLKNGIYLVVASEEKELSKNNIFGTTTIQATNLTLVQNTFNNTHNYQIVDRNHGEPIKNAEIHLENEKRQRGAHINKKLITDKNGFASFKSYNYYQNVEISVKTKNDIATFGNQYLRENDRNYNNQTAKTFIKPFIFTDRSIYRPGQTVYFKAIVLKKQGEKSEIYKNEFVKIVLKDVNNQEVKKLNLKLNEFGTIAGEFILPNNGLTGNFSISVDESLEEDSNEYYRFDYQNSITISVEEYKRPKFETGFKPITETFKINDSVTINGFAKAFSGATITDAKVVYRVHRKVQYPNWYYWHRPRPTSSSQEITNGETTTNTSGNFSIQFKALADESISKENLPVFTYEITADVTDVNGETRSATSIVKVGYHALLATISMEDQLNKNLPENKLTIETKNLNGEFVPAKGTLKIYKLQAPKSVQRQRPWNVPFYQDISENTFRKLFPNEAYSKEEMEEKNWKKGQLVFSTNFNTENEKEISLKNINKWVSGKYMAVLESEDKFGQTVKDEKKFSIFSNDDKKVADNKLFVIKTDKTIYKTGDEVLLQVGSASKDITVVVQIEKHHKIVKTHLMHLNNSIKTLKIPVEKEDLGGFAIKYHFVNYNYFESGNLLVNVTEVLKNIKIETNIFRDKLQPGAEQTWSFTIKDDKNNAVASEVLASMYDASLDQFKPHNWFFNPITPKQTYYSYQTSSANYSFGVNNFNIQNNNRPYYGFPNISYTSYNWFGFSLNNNNWLSRSYLRQIERKLKSSRKNFDGIVSGFVANENGEPLPGASIIIKGTTFGTETDFDGNYSLKIKKGDVLIFSYLGYKTEEITVNNYKNLDIKLTPDESALDEVVVTGYGSQKIKSATSAVSMMKVETENVEMGSSLLEEKVAGVTVSENSKIRGLFTISDGKTPLYIVDGKEIFAEDVKKLNPADIAEINVLKNAEATSLYGEKGTNGVVIITTKNAINNRLSQVKARTNFNETAFFYPQLRTNKNGKVSFTFTMPEALTRWKLQLLAHTKGLKWATKTMQTVTQKELMLVPNAPRFLREGDKITLSAKITNLTNNKLSGFAKLILTDAITGKDINIELKNTNSNKKFTVDKDGNTSVSWNLSIPETAQAVQYKMVAKAGDFSDGEQNVLPVLSNRMLVTETLPMWIRANQTKTFTLDKLKKNASSTLKNHKLTLEFTSNPVWYAIQSLPYLMEYPYECAEQTFSRYYANTLASFVANSNPRIQEVFNAWKNSDALLSNLEKNQALKSLIIQETPWLRDAQSETEQKKRIALLFDLNKMKNEQEKALNKLQDIQMNSGGFPWFKGSRYENTYITQHIASGFGHLQKLGVTNFNASTQKMIEKAVLFLDKELLENYKKLLERADIIRQKAKTKKEGEKQYNAYLAKNHLSYFTIQYLYMRSFYDAISMNSNTKKANDYYINQSVKYWKDYNLYAKGQIALSLFRNDKKIASSKILASLKETSITSNELGMYWKENTAGYYYYQAPVETQALMIEVFSEAGVISTEPKSATRNLHNIDNLKIWLLKNKQTNRWKTTKATTEAVYALLLNGSDWVSVTEMAAIKVGNKTIDPTKMDDAKVEAGTGYFKTSWNGEEITPEMCEVTINKKGNGIAWGGLYWQYFEDLDKITSAETPLKLNKKLFKKVNSNTGKKLIEITNKTKLEVGDLITVRIELRSDRNMEFIHMKDMRAAGVEPINVLSKYKWQDNLGYYESTKDAATNFFFDRLPKGVYVFEYDVRVNNAGNFSNGITTIQSMYAPEFSSHSKGVRISVQK